MRSNRHINFTTNAINKSYHSQGWSSAPSPGAISPAGSAQVLPARDDCLEAFQSLAREIRQAKGETVVMRVEQFEGLSDQELIDLFHAACEEDYAEIERQVIELGKTLSKRAKAEDRSQAKDELEKLQRRYLEIRRVDYFNSSAGERVACDAGAPDQCREAID